MRIETFAATDIGHHREQNEDAFAVCPDLSHPDWNQNEICVDFSPMGSLLVVADGMGGANAGEVASAIAIETFTKLFTPEQIAPLIQNEALIPEFLTKAVVAADENIHQQMALRPELYGMGTTIVVCWLLNNKAHVIWCGDSRCYVYNKRHGLKALTKDHSYVQELVDKGELTEEEALYHPDNNIITRGLGCFDTGAEPDIATYDLRPNDIILLCSDGLYGYCNNKTIEKIIQNNRTDLKTCRDQLMEAALKAGAEDNITIAIARVINDSKRRAHWLAFLCKSSN